MPLGQVNAGDRILASDINAYYNILKGVAASGETVTLVYNAAGVIAFQPSSDPAAGTQLFQIKNNAGTVKSALTNDGGAVFSARVHNAQGAAIASGATLTPGVDGNYFQVSGTTTITSIATAQAGSLLILEFQGALTLTHNGTSLILRTATNATTAAGDIFMFVSEGSGNWREISRLTGSTVIPAATVSALGTLAAVDQRRFTVQALGTLTVGTTAVNFALGDRITATLGGAITFTFSNPTTEHEYKFVLTQDGTGSRVVTWPTVKWSGGTAPVLTTAINKIDIITFTYDGTNYYGSSILNY